MTFDTPIDRRGTHCMKWDGMAPYFGAVAPDTIPMWVADMEFRPPAVVQQAVERMAAHGVYGYFGNDRSYLDAVRWWMETRHHWSPDPAHIFTTHGLVNAVGLCIDAFTNPGDGVVLFTPVYHAFARVIRAAGRTVVECPLTLVDGRHEMDFAAYDALMTGGEQMVILCSPHNPGGRVWSRGELQAVAAFAKRHDLVLISDEIHADLVLPGHHHTAMTRIEGVADRLVMLTAATKTFNIAGAHTGNVIIADPDLRATFAARMGAMGISPNSFGMHMVTAAYSPAGAQWVDDLCQYLDGNRRVLDAGLNAIPGVQAMHLESTYLAWVDFRGTGMDQAEIVRRFEQDARVTANHGPTFGTGGEGWMRLNFAAPRAQLALAVERVQQAFADLQ
jgi:cysteine-S-conjugate beta-lyase